MSISSKIFIYILLQLFSLLVSWHTCKLKFKRVWSGGTLKPTNLKEVTQMTEKFFKCLVSAHKRHLLHRAAKLLLEDDVYDQFFYQRLQTLAEKDGYVVPLGNDFVVARINATQRQSVVSIEEVSRDE